MSKKTAAANLRVVDHDVAQPPRPDDLAVLSVPLTTMLTAEFDEAQSYLRAPGEALILAALGRTIARTLGSGHVPVDIGLGSFTVLLSCTTVREADATDALCMVHRSLLAGHENRSPRSDILLQYLHPSPDTATRRMLPSRGHALELRVYLADGQLQMDWWYDTRRIDPYTVEELTEQFPLALIDLTSDATPLVDGVDVAMAGIASRRLAAVERAVRRPA
jgi:hypothetical protein